MRSTNLIFTGGGSRIPLGDRFSTDGLGSRMTKILTTAWIMIGVVVVGLLIWRRINYVPDEGCPVHKTDMVSLICAVEHFEKEFGVHPTGTTHQILSSLRGQNERELLFLILNDPPGAFLDPWGTPYEIEIEKEKITVSCAGANAVHGDEDDIVKTKEPNKVSISTDPSLRVVGDQYACGAQVPGSSLRQAPAGKQEARVRGGLGRKSNGS